MKFRERMEKIFKEGIETSKDVLEKAKEKTKEAGEKGALKIKIKKRKVPDFLFIVTGKGFILDETITLT